MPRKGKSLDDVGPEGLGEAYVPVIFARSHEDAEIYCQLLEDHDVPAVIDEDYEPFESQRRAGSPDGIPVLVPESLLEDARGFIADMENMNNFLEDEDDWDDEDEPGEDCDFAFDEEGEES